MLKMKFDFRDLFAAPRMAFSIQRIWIQFVGMLVGYASYLVFTYLSYIVSGYAFDAVWQKFGLLPCLYASAETYPWFAWVLFALGSLGFFLAYLVANTAVARAVYMVGKGNSFYTWKEAYSFALHKFWSVFLTPVSLVVLILLLVLGGSIVGFLGNVIPFIGPLGVSFFTILWFIASLLIFFFIIIVLVSLLMVPSIIATTDEDAFEAVFQAFSITWAQPWRLIMYQVMAFVLSIVSFGLFAFAVKKSIVIMNGIFIGSMGSEFINFSNNGLAMVQSWTIMFQSFIVSIFQGAAPEVFFRKVYTFIPASELGMSVLISSYFYAISLLMIGGWVISYGISTFTSSNTIAYMVLRYNKDQENLLERKDAEEEEDQVEEITEQDSAE